MTRLPWHRPERRAQYISSGIGVVFLVAVGLWVAGLPGVEDLPTWFYRPLGFRELAPSAWCWVGALVPPLALAAFAAARRGRTALALTCLVTASLGAQVFVLALDRDTLAYRMEQGHGDFFRVAHERRGHFVETMRNYSALSDEGALGVFAPPKPQGTLAFYMMIDELGHWSVVQWITGPVIAEFRARPLLAHRAEGAAAGALLMPFFTALALIPVFFIARRVGGTATEGVAAALVFGSAPGMLLINYHADGALFPLLAAAVIALAVRSRREVEKRRARGWLALGGVVFGLGIWCNYSLLPLAGFLGIFLTVLDLERGAPPRAALLAATLDVALIALAALVLLVPLWMSGLFSDPVERFHIAVDYLRFWKGGAVGGLYGVIAGLEYWLWAGLPLLFVSLWALAGALRRLASFTPAGGDATVLAGFAVLVVIAFSTGCVEAARLWLWLTPLFALMAARLLRAEAPTDGPNLLWSQLALAQLALTVVMRFCQPW